MLQDHRTAVIGDSRNSSARLSLFLGPAALISVGYIDPGNWATDVEGGARFGYALLWVLVLANLIALLLQTLATRLAVVTRHDLAQACRAAYAKPVSVVLWLLAEIAIIACDLAEVLGSALALNLLFGLPLIWGASLTSLDVLLVLALQSRGVRALEAFVFGLVLLVAACLAVEVWLIQPAPRAIASGLMPTISWASLYVAIGMLGATVMPHNLYLHGALSKTRRVEPNDGARRQALRYYLVDTSLGLNVALLINAAILITAAALFYERGIAINDLRDAHALLTPLLGNSLAALLFACALLFAGQSAAITGTLAGQVVMEGFLHWRLTPLLRRALTRGIAIVPALLTIGFVGDRGVSPLLIASQIILSLQLPFAVIPLIRLTNDHAWMGRFVNGRWVSCLSRACAGLVIAANLFLAGYAMQQVIDDSSRKLTVATISLMALIGIAALSWLGFMGWIAIARLQAPPRQSQANDNQAMKAPNSAPAITSLG